MHIPDGYLGPKTFLTMYGVMAPIWARAGAKVRQAALKRSGIGSVALASAFSFTVMMFSVPIPGGTTGHAVGSTLLAITIGPWPAVAAVSVALAVQAFLFGDGGVTALGANSFSAAFIGVFVGFYLYKWLWRLFPKHRLAAAGVASYISLNAVAQVSAVLVGLQPIIERTGTGLPLYAPLPLTVTVPAMGFVHLVLGFVEAGVTVAALSYLQRDETKPLV